jgi:DNA primase
MARMIPKRVLEEVRYRNDIAEVIGTYITLKRSGSRFKCCCPFHKEKTPSFIVNPQMQIYHCFGCGAGGDVFRFIQEFEGVDFTTAVKILGQKAGIPIETEDADPRETSDKELLYRIHGELAQFYQRCLHQMKSAECARRYLQERGLPADVVEEFAIGFAPMPRGWDAVIQWGRKHKFDLPILEKAGLILRSERSGSEGRYYDRFRQRLMFPIRDAQNRVIGFSGRLLEADPRAAKYVNSPETPIFRKSRVLYALEKARRHIVAADPREAIVCEGQIDVIRCHQAGFVRAVASQGTAFTEEHARILGRYADGVVIVFDSDRAGQDAAVKTAALFMEAGLAVRVATLPAGEDPDTFISEHGAEPFQHLLDTAVSAVGYQADVLASRRNIHSQIGAMNSARDVLETIRRSPNAVQRAALVQEAAAKLNLPASALQDELRKLMRRTRRPGPAATPEEATATERPSHPPEEVCLCEHMVHAIDHPEIADLVNGFLPLEFINDPACRRIVTASLEARRLGRDVAEMLHADADGEQADELKRLAAAVLMAPSRVPGNEFKRADAVKGLILRLWVGHMKGRRDDLEQRRSAPEHADDTALAAESFQLRKDIAALESWETGADVILLNLPEE